MEYAFLLKEFSRQDLVEVSQAAPSEEGVEEIPINTRFYQLTVYEESVVALYPVRNIAIFDFWITAGSFEEDGTTLHLDVEVSLENFYDLLGDITTIPQDILTILMVTKVCAMRTAESITHRLTRYNFPKTKEKQRFYLDTFSEPHMSEFLQAELIPAHRAAMDNLIALG